MDANVIGLRNLLEFYKNKMSKAFFIFQQARFMEILIKRIFQQKKLIEEMFHALVLEHVTMSQKIWRNSLCKFL